MRIPESLGIALAMAVSASTISYVVYKAKGAWESKEPIYQEEKALRPPVNYEALIAEHLGKYTNAWMGNDTLCRFANITATFELLLIHQDLQTLNSNITYLINKQ